MAQARLGIQHDTVRAERSFAVPSELSGDRLARRQPAQSRSQGILRSLAVASLALRRLLHNDQGKLAVDRTDADARRLRRRRAVGFRHHGVVRDWSTDRQVGLWREAAGLGPRLEPQTL